MSSLPFLDKSKSDENSADKETRKKLPAEVFFDKAVYGGISYAAQAATGILVARWLRYGSGKKHFDKVAKWLGPKLFPSKPLEKAIEDAGTPIMVTTMIMVGNAFIPPVKWLENHKPKIVRHLHERSVEKQEKKGNVFSEEEKAEHQECLEQLEKEPKQTWKSLIGGRVFGLAAVYSVLFGIGHKNNVSAENYSAKTIMKGLDTIGLKTLAQNKTLESYIHVGFLDVFYSAVSTAGLYVYSHFINPPKKGAVSVEPASKALASNDIPATVASVPAESINASPEPKQKSFQDIVKKKEIAKNTHSSFAHKIAAEEVASEARLQDRITV